jgi:hypothetical protein
VGEWKLGQGKGWIASGVFKFQSQEIPSVDSPIKIAEEKIQFSQIKSCEKLASVHSDAD